MKRLLGITLALASMGFGSSSEAKAIESPYAVSAVETHAVTQWQRTRNYRRYNWRRPMIVTRSRVVRVGHRLYRETYQVRYLPNGRTKTRLISRLRIGVV
jgi:hypothetical protein